MKENNELFKDLEMRTLEEHLQILDGALPWFPASSHPTFREIISSISNPALRGEALHLLLKCADLRAAEHRPRSEGTYEDASHIYLLELLFG